jgi:hypothetical protein
MKRTSWWRWCKPGPTAVSATAAVVSAVEQASAGHRSGGGSRQQVTNTILHAEQARM